MDIFQGNICKTEETIIDINGISEGVINNSFSIIKEEVTFPRQETPPNYKNACALNAQNTHFFYPTYDEDDMDDNEEDPLANKFDKLNSPRCEEELNTVEDELFNIENIPTVSTSFSIVDPSSFTTFSKQVNSEPVSEHFDVAEDGIGTSSAIETIKSNVGKIKRTRVSTTTEDLNEVSEKKLKLNANYNLSIFDLKNFTVNIGPKLPLPTCFKQNSSCSDYTLENKNIVLKIYTCAKCSHKCTDLTLHESHVAACTENSSKDKIDLPLEPRLWKGYYYCETCLFKFKDFENLKIHMSKHPVDKYFTCSICGSNFLTINILRSHCREAHKDCVIIFNCNICDYSAIEGRYLKTHMINHNSDKHLYCYICRRNFENSSDYHKHSLKVHKNETVKTLVLSKKNCKNIDNSMYNKENKKFLKTKLNIPDEVIFKDNMYFCNGCPYKFSKKENLDLHKKRHININIPYKCLSCPYKSLSLVSLKAHVNSHKVKPRFGCNICSVTFNEWRSLRLHAATHVYDELFCWECKCNFEDEESLHLHVKFEHEYDNKKMYSCSKCSFKHYQDRVLKIHSKKHERQDCRLSLKDESHSVYDSKVFNDIDEANEIASKKNLQNTIKKEETIKHPKKSKWIFKCGKCEYSCSQYKLLKKHNDVTHRYKDPPYKCSECENESMLLKSYLDHAGLHANGVTYLCRYCRYTTRHRSKFEEHNLKHNNKNCPMCSYRTVNSNRFVEHLQIHKQKKGKKLFSCNLCPYFCQTLNLLSTHTIKFHPKEFMSTKLPLPIKYNISLKCHSCSMCTYRSNRSFDLKRHMTSHFIKGSYVSNKYKYKTEDSRLNSTKVSKSSSAEIKSPAISVIGKTTNYYCSQCEFKSKDSRVVSSHLRKKHNITGGVRDNMVLKSPLHKCRPSYISGDIQKIEHNTKPRVFSEIDNEIHYYKCTRCQYGSTNRKTVSKHLWRKHNITGGVRNSVILKVSDPSKLSDDKNNLTTINNSTPDIFKGDVVAVYYKCSQCNLIKNNRDSVANHLKVMHNITGGVRNSMILKVSDPCKLSDDKNNLTTINNSTPDILKGDVDTVYYKCSQCNLIKNNRDSVANHLKLMHNITGGVRNSMILKVSDPSKLSDDENNLTTINNSTPDILKGDVDTVYYKCSQCNLIKNNRDSVANHLKLMHNITGGVRNSMILKVSDPCKLSDDKNNLTTINNSTPDILKGDVDTVYYKCSQCNLIKNNRDSVANHLKLMHNITGGVRNSMILKVSDPSKLSDDENNLTTINNSTPDILKGDVDTVYYKCSQCNLIKNNRDSVANHLKLMHNITGGLRNSMILMVSDPCKLSDDKNNLTTINNSTPGILKGDVDTVYYKCSQCNLIKNNRDSVANHLKLMHNITGGVRNSMILKVSDPSKLLDDENNLTTINNSPPDILKGDVDTVYYKCSQCNLIKNNRDLVSNHLKVMHNITGGVRNSMILKVSDPCKLSDDENNLPTINNSTPDNLKEDVNPVCYKCSQCKFKKKKRDSVVRHLREVHNITGGLRNNMIVKVSISTQKIIVNGGNTKQSSLTEKHKTSNENHVTCSKCNIHQFSNLAQIDHLKNGHETFWKKPFSCGRCGGVRFTGKQSFARHNARFHENSFKCEICQSYTTQRKNDLLRHQKSCMNSMIEEVQEEENQEKIEKNTKSIFDGEAISDDENYSCGECDYVTDDVTDLINHMFEHTGIPDD